MRTEDMESGRYAAFCLGNLAANDKHRQAVMDAGGAEALVALLACEVRPPVSDSPWAAAAAC